MASSQPPAYHDIISGAHTGCLTLAYVRYDDVRYAPQWAEPNIIIISAYTASFHDRSQNTMYIVAQCAISLSRFLLPDRQFISLKI